MLSIIGYIILFFFFFLKIDNVSYRSWRVDRLKMLRDGSFRFSSVKFFLIILFILLSCFTGLSFCCMVLVKNISPFIFYISYHYFVHTCIEMLHVLHRDSQNVSNWLKQECWWDPHFIVITVVQVSPPWFGVVSFRCTDPSTSFIHRLGTILDSLRPVSKVRCLYLRLTSGIIFKRLFMFFLKTV